MFNKAVLLVFVLSLSLAGCTSLKKLSGQTNDTVLPGAREDILPPDQQTARDPAITGGQPAAGGAIQQQTMVPPNAPQTAQKGDLLPGHEGTVVACDPLVETCPGMEPQPKVAAKGKPPAGKVIVPPGGAVAASAKPKTAKTTTAGVPAEPAVENVGTDPMKPVVKPLKKKVKKKKLVLKPEAAAPSAPDAAAAPDATQTPPPVPPDVKTP